MLPAATNETFTDLSLAGRQVAVWEKLWSNLLANNSQGLRGLGRKRMNKFVFKTSLRLVLLAIVLCFMAGSAFPQGASSITGRWTWKEVARKNKPQRQFSLVIRRAGKVVQGTYSVDEFINGKWQGEDGNQTPFRGETTATGARVLFDSAATVPGYEENVIYKAPADGSKPSVAVLVLKAGTLEWRLVEGDQIGVPAKVVLRREGRRR